MENTNNTAQAAAATNTEQSTAPTENKAVLSFEELLKNKDYQSEFDRRVTKALETAKANWEKEEQVKQTEAKRLAAMNEEQKAEHKRAQAEKQLAEREAAVTKRELTATAKEQLIEKGFPPELSGVLDYSNAEKCKQSIETVSSVFSQAVEKAVNERLKSPPPKTGQSGGAKEPATLADALRMQMQAKKEG